MSKEEKNISNNLAHLGAFLAVPPLYIGWRIYKWRKGTPKSADPPVNPPVDPPVSDPPSTGT